jgi:hypothetical protein
LTKKPSFLLGLFVNMPAAKAAAFFICYFLLFRKNVADYNRTPISEKFPKIAPIRSLWNLNGTAETRTPT